MIPVFPNKDYSRYLVSNFVMVICSYATMLADAAVGGFFLGEEAVSAINLVLPVSEAFYALTLLLGFGASVVAAMDYGKGELTSVRRRFTVAFSSTTTLLSIFALALFLCRNWVVDFLVAGSSLHTMVFDYLTAMIPWFIVNEALLVFKEFTILCGKPTLVMRCAIVQFAVNICCNIFFLGVLGWGIWALAISSLISASVMFFLLLLNYVKSDCPFRWTHCSMTEYRAALRTHIRYGSGFLTNDVSFLVFAFVMNTLILRLMGETSLFVWSVIIMVYYTINYASAAGSGTCLTLGGHYMGLGQMAIVKQINRRTYLYVTGWMLFVMAVTFLSPHQAMPLFGASDPSYYAMLLPVIALTTPFTLGSNMLNLMLLPLLQQERIFLYCCLTMVMYFHLPLLLLLFHYLSPGDEWWGFLGMVPVIIILYQYAKVRLYENR